MKKIVHVVSDEKFIDMAYREFEHEAPGKNIFVIANKPHELKYIKFAQVVFLNDTKLKSLFSSSNCCTIIFHSLGNHCSRLLGYIPNEKRVMWFGWGYDYYTSLLSAQYPDGLLLPETQQIAEQCLNGDFLSTIKTKLKSCIKKIIRRDHISESLLKKVDYFIPVLETEYKLALKLNPWFKPKFTAWNYGTLEDDFLNDDTTELLGGNILVGNSAAMENNHIEVFNFISNNIDISGKKIIVPLSYGDSRYAEYIINIGYDLFGSAFVPLRNFMNKDEYIELLQGCGYVFMNHLRQQALGNINIMLLNGAKIFLNSSSPVYDWLIKEGAYIFAMGCLACHSTEKIKLTPLELHEKAHNKQIMMNHWSRNIQRKKTRKLIEIALTNQTTLDHQVDHES